MAVDCADLERAARFWADALGYVSEGGADGTRYRSLLPAGGPGIEVLLQRTDDAKHGKNRVHLDLRTRDLDAEVRRVTALGATVLTSSRSRSTAGRGTSSPTRTATSSASSGLPRTTGPSPRWNRPCAGLAVLPHGHPTSLGTSATPAYLAHEMNHSPTRVIGHMWSFRA